MEIILKKLRFLDPKNTDRILLLINHFSSESKNILVFQLLLNKLQVLLIKKDIPSINKYYSMLLNNIEYSLIKKYGYNLVIRNIPIYAKNINGKRTAVDILEIVDTLKQFGEISIKQVIIISNVSYIQIIDIGKNKILHNILNNMQMCYNIITTEYY